ncbi:MAG: hypothetical protein ACI9G1_005713, partial [Pirellulaceae bacterium]
ETTMNPHNDYLGSSESRYAASRLRGRCVVVCVWMILLGGIVATPSLSQEVIDRQKEYNLKAVFLYSFGKYISWQDASANQGDFVICVLGESPITPKLKRVGSKRTLNGRKLRVEVVQWTDSPPNCHLLFVASHVPVDEAATLIEQVSHDTVVVGERRELLEKGASIIFFIDGASVRFELDHVSLQKKKIQVDAKLQKLSRSPN